MAFRAEGQVLRNRMTHGRVITSWPYRAEPMLHLYAGLLILQLGSLELPAERAETGPEMEMQQHDAVCHFPPFDAEKDADLLRIASHHFEGCVNAGISQSNLMMAERRRMKSSQQIKTKKARRRVDLRSKKRKRGIAETEEEESSEEAVVDRRAEEEEREGEEMDDEGRKRAESPAARDQWAVEMARAYLDVVSAIRGSPRENAATQPRCLAMRSPLLVRFRI